MLFFFLTERNFSYPVRECYHLNIPVISNLDTNYSFYSYVSYPILSNSHSTFLNVFYFILFMKAYQKGKFRSFQHMFQLGNEKASCSENE